MQRLLRYFSVRSHILHLSPVILFPIIWYERHHLHAAGHTHKDEFEISYSDYTAQSYSNAVEVSYIAPAMTPTSGMPAFRVYSVDPETFAILDMTTYIADMSAPDYQTAGPSWSKYYSVKEAYGPLVNPPLTDSASELTPAFWHNLTEVFASDQTVFNEYLARKSRGYNVGSCTGSCATNEICQLRAAQSQYNCVTVSPGVNFKKSKRSSGETASEHSDSCEGSSTAKILRALVADKESKASFEKKISELVKQK